MNSSPYGGSVTMASNALGVHRGHHVEAVGMDEVIRRHARTSCMTFRHLVRPYTVGRVDHVG